MRKMFFLLLDNRSEVAEIVFTVKPEEVDNVKYIKVIIKEPKKPKDVKVTDDISSTNELLSLFKDVTKPVKLVNFEIIIFKKLVFRSIRKPVMSLQERKRVITNAV